MKRYDLVALGEPLLRFSPPGVQRLDYADRFDVRVVGSQLNVAADCARLGLATAFLTQLPDSPLGDLAQNKIQSYGVDTTLIRRRPDSRIGATYVEFTAAPRTPRAVYDRRDSAAAQTTDASFDWDKVAASAAMLYTDGIFPALSPGCRAAAGRFLAAGKKHGCRNCFDLNFRRHLWTAEAARACWSELLPLVDVAVTNRTVCEEVFGWSGDDRTLTERFAREFGIGTVAFTAREGEGMKQGGWQALVRSADGGFASGAIAFEIVDRYGTGDAWFAGFLTAMQDRSIEESIHFANAVIALAHTTFGDVIECTRSEVEQLLTGAPTRLAR